MHHQIRRQDVTLWCVSSCCRWWFPQLSETLILCVPAVLLPCVVLIAADFITWVCIEMEFQTKLGICTDVSVEHRQQRKLKYLTVPGNSNCLFTPGNVRSVGFNIVRWFPVTACWQSERMCVSTAMWDNTAHCLHRLLCQSAWCFWGGNIILDGII